MESINISNMPPQRVMVKEAFTRLVPSASLTPIGEAKSIGSVGLLSYSYENPARQPMSQADFMREYDVNAHKINSLKYYPNAFLKDNNGKVAAKIRSRIAVAWQKRILVKRLATLTGNNVNIRLSNSKRTEKDQQLLNDFREGWENKNMENLIFQSIRADGIVGDVAACLYMDNQKVGWRVFSFLEGDVLYPHYDPLTGRLAVFGRRYSVRDEQDNEIVEYLDVYDDTHYMRYKRDKAGLKGAVSKVKGVLGMDDWGIDVEARPHGFQRIPIAYDRYGEPFWANSQDCADLYELTVSQLAENNQAYALRILYALGGEIEMISNMDGTPAMINSTETNTKVGFLEPADSSRSFELQLNILEKAIMRNSFASETPELKSGSDLSSLTVRMLMMDSYQQALLDAQHFQPFLDDVVELFKYGYGIEMGRSSDFEMLKVKAEIFPYVFMSETEQVSNIMQLRSAGALSKQTASEMAYELGYGINSEYERIVSEERNEMLGTQQAVQGSSKNNVVNEARNKVNG
jgi:hypothetical protein